MISLDVGVGRGGLPALGHRALEIGRALFREDGRIAAVEFGGRPVPAQRRQHPSDARARPRRGEHWNCQSVDVGGGAFQRAESLAERRFVPG